MLLSSGDACTQMVSAFTVVAMGQSSPAVGQALLQSGHVDPWPLPTLLALLPIAVADGTGSAPCAVIDHVQGGRLPVTLDGKRAIGGL